MPTKNSMDWDNIEEFNLLILNADNPYVEFKVLSYAGLEKVDINNDGKEKNQYTFLVNDLKDNTDKSLKIISNPLMVLLKGFTPLKGKYLSIRKTFGRNEFP